MLTTETARTWYALDDPVHGYDHVVRVYHLAERIAEAEGADLDIVRAAALLHDVGGGGHTEQRVSHQENAADFARGILEAEGWSEPRIQAVLHCIRAHRFREARETPQTLEAQVLFDADKLDAIGAVGIMRSIAYAVKHHQPLYTLPSARFLASGEKEPEEPHTPYHEYLFKLRKLKERLYTPTARALAEDRDRLLHTFFEQLQAELLGRR